MSDKPKFCIFNIQNGMLDINKNYLLQTIFQAEAYIFAVCDLLKLWSNYTNNYRIIIE